ncbi:lipid-A-disaccharide synthase [Stappia taiwanensis]|uniref:Lipid-A-disaccharide synthase n=1 Tax=Stappia taiwanensis TaxID=992267 RepID=A0A838XNI2_9HYPH|nr:lipid-A-disaccharide synthase [Stappia taiwanensis]MBA4610308.1 lipid-A-disaccharide synthase [Stappia taiwanensis]GGE78538.1 lipid-A-disaccharide synthase [Stappia taiwanensis]
MTADQSQARPERPRKPLNVYLIVGEESGDQLGARLMRSLKGELGEGVRFRGVGGERMAGEGLTSLFPISDIAVMGLTAVLPRLPTIVRRVYQAVDDAIAANPDVLVIIDSPDFTHNVAKRVRKRAPHIPIVDYVSPSVWAWRSGRARKMAAYVDHLLAILPFEPAAHRRLGGPPTSYVGHPLIERIDELRPADGERTRLEAPEAERVLLLLPGSRRSEVSRLLTDFGQAVERVHAEYPNLRVLLPAVPHLADDIRAQVAGWKTAPEIVLGEEAKFAAFRSAHAALAASGTVSLELAIAGVPMIIAYRLDWVYRRIKDLNKVLKFAGVTSMVLPNIILEENAVPEFLDDDASPETLAAALVPLLADTPERARQTRVFSRLDDAMQLDNGETPSGRAARIVIAVARGEKPD